MQVYLPKTGSIIMHIDLYFQIKAIFTVFKHLIFYQLKSFKLLFLENLHTIISQKELK